MKNRILVACLFALVTTTAHAQSVTTSGTTKCARDFMGAMVCSSTTTSGPATANTVGPKLSKQEIAESDERDAQWVAFCSPTIVTGVDGIDRYRYAKAGCEFGRSR